MSTPVVLPGQGRRLLVFVGPSGAGKDSVLRAWLEALPAAQRPHRVRRTITRPTDLHEAHEPMDDVAFERARAAGLFAVDWQAHGLNYGVRWQEFAPLRQGRWVCLNGSRAHLPALRQLAPAMRVVEITASADLLALRLAQRGRESQGERTTRLARTGLVTPADLRVMNDEHLSDAVAQVQAWWSGLKFEEIA